MSLSLLIMAQPSKVAFLSTFESLSSLQNEGDDDEYAAANWLVNSYGGDFLPISQIKNGNVTLNNYKALWIHFDREFEESLINSQFENSFLDEDIINSISSFYKAGGNLLLSIFATRYVKDLGRYDLNVNIKSFGSGGDIDDVWYFSPTWGTYLGAPEVINKFDDPIFNELDNVLYIIRDNGDNYPIIPLLGAGWKEDHNYFWNPQPDKANDDLWKFKDFENIHYANSLATWAHVQDYFGTAITRWNKKDEYNGKIITIGIGAYEWNQNSGTNPYQANIERLTRNALDELSTFGMSTYSPIGINEKLKVIINNNTISFQNISKMVSCKIYSIDGKLINIFQLNQENSFFDITHFKDGIYFLEANDEQNSITFKFIKSIN